MVLSIHFQFGKDLQELPHAACSDYGGNNGYIVCTRDR